MKESTNTMNRRRFLAAASLSAASLGLPVPVLAQEIELHLRSYLIHVLEREVRSAAFIDRLRREGSREPACRQTGPVEVSS